MDVETPVREHIQKAWTEYLSEGKRDKRIRSQLHKIPTKKLRKSAFTGKLSRLKYAVLLFFVLLIPAWFALRRLPLPAFCKYICPAGTLEGALFLLLHPANGALRAMAGGLFLWKLTLLVLILTVCVFVFRAFCRFLCPLGALYGLMARLALLGVRVEESRCTDCGACVRRCPMDIRRVGDSECVHCGDCIGICPEKAISFRAGRIVLRGQAYGKEEQP